MASGCSLDRKFQWRVRPVQYTRRRYLRCEPHRRLFESQDLESTGLESSRVGEYCRNDGRDGISSGRAIGAGSIDWGSLIRGPPPRRVRPVSAYCGTLTRAQPGGRARSRRDPAARSGASTAGRDATPTTGEQPKKNRRGLSTTPVVAGARKPGLVPLARWRSFLWDARRRAPRAAYPGARASSPRTPLYVALLRMGFAVPQALPSARWALTPPFHPYPAALAPGRFVFCGTVLEVALTGSYPASCSAEPGLSSRFTRNRAIA